MDFDFRLKVFYVAANTLNFTKAASELFISQPAVSKNIQEIENSIGTPLFERLGNRLALTPAGKILYKHAQVILEQYNQATYEINEITGKQNGNLFLGISTTISQYVIPKMLVEFNLHFPQNEIKVTQANSKRVEQLLIKNEIHLGITEGLPDNRSLKFTPYIKDEIVLVTRNTNPLCKEERFVLNDIYKLAFVFREPGSGTRDIIDCKLKEAGISLQHLHTEIILSSSESIKRYLKYSNTAAFLSIHAIQEELKNGDLKIIELEDFSIERYFYITHLVGGLAGLPLKFMNFIQQHKGKIYS
ncbi:MULTISPECIES: LysR family transcriptional regulator [Sphingobacterium]|jgi:DNA-binding transcriptional LysR family regulator|uniref:LysR family transcriptional regulator n=1 Tax=Sphingobacterium TaxID=28453 RepID=UPI00104ABE4E|nr:MULTISPECIES: LysR family transcriptional regulator [unclassified Sphingobacterium]MCS3553088.1 DNA-binding transcriptional LysR family regulator [Sphingobacterium sp. JUb21]QQD15896.1 LysR family transcriptional regulator [Sphingobacterium sp. UDSM-2020]TCR09702.1 DNA-binding transcriptional LysR family regulator [Sphingobacterium sp. JUb20]